MTQIPVSWIEKTIEEGAQSVTFACVSELTGEEGGIVVRSQTTLDDVMREYVNQFPKEALAFKIKVKEMNDGLTHSSAMSQGKRMMSLTSIPEFILWAMRAKSREYWDDKERVYSFIRSYPAFMIGDHRIKPTNGVIIK